jgi:hypothetical protein
LFGLFSSTRQLVKEAALSAERSAMDPLGETIARPEPMRLGDNSTGDIGDGNEHWEAAAT